MSKKIKKKQFKMEVLISIMMVISLMLVVFTPENTTTVKTNKLFDTGIVVKAAIDDTIPGEVKQLISKNIEKRLIKKEIIENVIQEEIIENVIQEEIIENVIQEEIEEEPIQEGIEEPIQEEIEEEPIQEEIDTNVNLSVAVNQDAGFSIYADLQPRKTITADEMNVIIDYWCYTSGCYHFQGAGQEFIDAANASGLDPIYLLAHAGLESGWGSSTFAQVHNYYGIGAFDSNANCAYGYANDSRAAGIINGAIFISNNYYQNGQTTLYSMRYNGGSHEYCTSDTWMYNIESIVLTSYSLI